MGVFFCLAACPLLPFSKKLNIFESVKSQILQTKIYYYGYISQNHSHSRCILYAF